MKHIDDQYVQFFMDHCYDCSKITNCVYAFQASQSCNCEHFDKFARVMKPVEEYINECLYNEFVKMMEEVKNGNKKENTND